MLPSRQIPVSNNYFRDEWALNLGDTDEYIDAGDWTEVIQGDFMVSMWIYLEDGRPSSEATFFGAVIDSDNKYDFSITTGGALKISVEFDGVSAEETLLHSQWTNSDYHKWRHILISHNQSAGDWSQIFKISINGSSILQMDTNHTADERALADFSSQNFYIGGRNNAGTFDKRLGLHRISEVAVYKDTFESTSYISGIASEMINNRTQYNHAEGIRKDKLWAWWRFGDGTEQGKGNKIYDMSGNGNHATAVNTDDTNYRYLDSAKYGI